MESSTHIKLYVISLIRHKQYNICENTVMGVIKMGNIVPRTGIKPTFLAHMLTLTPPRMPDVTT